MTEKSSLKGYYINREASWLEFNRRVLEEAEDPRNPLLERLRFFCIFHSNLDEFFMVRVASLRRRVEENDSAPDPAGLTPYAELELIRSRVWEIVGESYELYNTKLRPGLAEAKIRILDDENLRPEHRKYVDDYFDREVYPILTPLAIDVSHPTPHLSNLTTNLAILVVPEKQIDAERRLAVIPLPWRMSGLIRLPDSDGHELCWLADVVRTRASRFFTGFRIVESGTFRLTRDAALELDDEGPVDYVHMLESELGKRRQGAPIRMEHDPTMSAELRGLLQERLQVDESALMPVKGPLDPRPLMTLVDLPGHDQLRFPTQPPLVPVVFREYEEIFGALRDQDVLLHHPYDSFDPIVELVRAAAVDPDVLAIKQTLYRTSGKSSSILESLVKAAKNGKQVLVLMELTARFDEERNIEWVRDLEMAGAHVLYGVVGLKVHAKITLVVRRESDGIRRYVHLGTGNYNERTARQYTDFSLLTSDDDFGNDASGFFNAITGYSEAPAFRHLVMAPAGLRTKLVSLIRREADRAKSGQEAEILAKMNSLVDPAIIQELCRASRAGVSIRLNVRGICCLRPRVPQVSDRVRVISIVDRYLEHGRAFMFHNGGDQEVFLSSADWMPRNLDRRIELMFPVLDPDAKAAVIDSLKAQFEDNQKARALEADGSYRRIAAGRAEPVRVQELLYQRQTRELERARTASSMRIVPIEGIRP